MSFILDALKKSEAERQQQGRAEFSGVPTSRDEPGPRRWLWILAALLGINLVVLAGILLRTPATPDVAPVAETAPVPAATSTQDEPATSFEDQVARVVEQRAELPAPTANDPADKRPAAVVSTPVPASVPTIDQLRLDGTLQLPDLHLDIHVFSEQPADRFVFINMVKHRERDRIPEGPLVREIRPDGVILEYQGTAFLLPRE